MKHVIVGTAGHIDHGKTALIKALTGIDADRLEEEKRRGITIDLGFAHLQITPSLTLGFVDVPGHERFVKNMLAGAGGIDMALLIVAADDSVKPQTREHFDICRLLAISRGVIALTKCDLVDDATLELVRLDVEEMVAGSFLDGAPVAAVSSVTGAGLDELRRALALVAESTPERNASGFPRLPIDRAFSVKGFGPVVTGTLISGSIVRDEELECYPGGQKLRVRGIEVHGEKTERAVAGQRTAVNLAGADSIDFARGDVLSEPGAFQAVRQLDCRLTLLPDAKPLKHRAPVHFHSGTAEIEAEVRLLDGSASLAPGGEGWARILLREPVLLLPGDRFIIRMFSPVATIGGGAVVDIAPEAAGRLRSGRDALIARLETLANPDIAARVALLVREAAQGMTMAGLIARTGASEQEIRAAARRAGTVAIGRAEGPRSQQWLLDHSWFDSKRAALVSAVRQFHRANPLSRGISREELRSRVLPGAPAFLLDALLAASSELTAESESVMERGRAVSFSPEEERARVALLRKFEDANFAPPSPSDALGACGLEPARARSLLALLLREGKLVRAGENLILHHAAMERLRETLAARKQTYFTVTDFKAWTGISRKYAIPLLEYFDRERITRREGDRRLVL